MPQKILVPVGGPPEFSPKSWEALEDAFSFDSNARFIVLHVFDPTEVINYKEEPDDEITKDEWIRGDWDKKAEERMKKISNYAEELSEDFDVEISSIEKFGDPVDVILDFVEGNEVDRIVMGSHNKPSGGHTFLGSVAEKVARRSPVSVTIVR